METFTRAVILFEAIHIDSSMCDAIHAGKSQKKIVFCPALTPRDVLNVTLPFRQCEEYPEKCEKYLYGDRKTWLNPQKDRFNVMLLG